MASKKRQFDPLDEKQLKPARVGKGMLYAGSEEAVPDPTVNWHWRLLSPEEEEVLDAFNAKADAKVGATSEPQR